MNKQDILSIIETCLKEISPEKRTSTLETVKDLLSLCESSCDESDLKLIQQTVNEIKRSHDTFYPFRQQKKVCIFGSARTKPNNPNYALAEEIALKLTQKNYHIITGAGPGIMEAGNKGAEKDKHFGLNIVLPFEQSANPYILHSDKLVSYKYFFLRKLYFIKESHASVILPGGFGTHDESFEVLTLIQTGRCAPRPIVYLCDESSDYWKKWDEYIKTQLLDRHYISEKDLHMYILTHSVDEAIQEIENFYYCYDSVRYNQHKAIMRLKKPISEETIETLKSEFSNLISNNELTIKHSSDVPEDAHIHHDKPRLVFHFDKVNYGGLTHFIKRMNQLELAKLDI